MKITVVDWLGGGILKEGSSYRHGQTFEGDADEAFRLARALYDQGLNVMVKRCPEFNAGTRRRPSIVPASIIVAVDTSRFEQR